MIHIYFKVIQLPALWSFTTMLISSDMKTILETVKVQGWPMTMMVYYNGSVSKTRVRWYSCLS